ncbi:glomulin, FKBP associated protein b [Hippocampus comes]|uniref:glomulin, FKBP associated protein b n=1 Tax=Hippocampus comes TaxID=109280 RepID=UPI00094E3874|nr:PREDICTED: glomulin-like [Hippocampus comes]
MVVKGLPERPVANVMMNEGKVNDLIQRWRDTPEEELTPEDREHFMDLACSCLAQGESERLLMFLQDDKNRRMVHSMGCVLLAPLMKEALKNEKSWDRIQSAITHVTTTCGPDEVLRNLLDVMEDTDAPSISETLVQVVPHLEAGLLRLTKGRASWLGSALRVLHKQLTRLPVPYTEEMEKEDQWGLGRCCHALTTFTQAFSGEVRNHEDGERREMKTELLNFCMRSLREPLLEAPLTPGTTTAMWLFASNITATLVAIQESAADLLFFSTMKKNIQMDKNQLAESKGCLAYLVFVKQLDAERFPIVFSPEFVLRRNLEYIHQLLRSKKESHVLKGLALFEKSLERAQDNSLLVTLLEVKSFYDVKQSLLQVLTECPMRHLRESGLTVLQLLINKLDAEAKHKLFGNLLKTSKHPGVEGYIVKNIRNQVEFSMKPGNATRWFLGTEFVSLLRLAFSLPQGTETNVLHDMDKIMESLNLLRYLLIRDKPLRSNADVWEGVCGIKEEYTKMLRVCISMSRFFYTGELNELRDEHKLKARAARASTCTRTHLQSQPVKRDTMSKMSPEVRHQVLQSALVTFDLMESLIARTEEIAAEKNHDRLDASALFCLNEQKKRQMF